MSCIKIVFADQPVKPSLHRADIGTWAGHGIQLVYAEPTNKELAFASSFDIAWRKTEPDKIILKKERGGWPSLLVLAEMKWRPLGGIISVIC